MRTPGFPIPIEAAGEVTLTDKNQITLPEAAIRLLGLKEGDRLMVQVMNQEEIILTRRPDNWTEHFSGKMGHVFGSSEEVQAYLEEERASWEEPDPDADPRA